VRRKRKEGDEGRLNGWIKKPRVKEEKKRKKYRDKGGFYRDEDDDGNEQRVQLAIE